MNFDPDALKALLAQDDETLWKTVCALAQQNGIALTSQTPPAEDLARLRSSLSRKEAADVMEAARILRDLRSGRER